MLLHGTDCQNIGDFAKTNHHYYNNKIDFYDQTRLRRGARRMAWFEPAQGRRRATAPVGQRAGSPLLRFLAGAQA